MDRKILARTLKSTCYLTGNFTLRSGRTSSYYWDKYRFESNPLLLQNVTKEMILLLPVSFDKIAGLELGGIPLATALSLEIGKPCLFVRKTANKYGTGNLVEGGFSAGERVVVIEDVITSGGQVRTSVEQMRSLGLLIDTVLCVIDRKQGGKENLEQIGCRLECVFHGDEL